MTDSIDVTDDVAFPVLDARQLAEVAEFGTEREVEAGDVLYGAGDRGYDFFVLLEGQVEIVRIDGEGEHLLATHETGRFVGELNLLTGQRAFLTARVSRSGRVLDVPPDEFRRMMSSKPALADVIFAALVARREALRSSDGALALRIIGSRSSREAMALRSFAARARLAFTWIDLEDAEDVEVLLASMGVRPGDTPVVI